MNLLWGTSESKLWNQVTFSSLFRWKILTLEKIKTDWVLWCSKVLISNKRQLCINLVVYCLQIWTLLHHIQPTCLNFQQRKSPEIWIPIWPEEVTWFHSFALYQVTMLKVLNLPRNRRWSIKTTNNFRSCFDSFGPILHPSWSNWAFWKKLILLVKYNSAIISWVKPTNCPNPTFEFP